MINSKNKKILKAVIFDFDGTLADTKEIYIKTIIKHLVGQGISKNNYFERFIEHFGKRLPEILKIMGIHESRIDDIAANIMSEVTEKALKKVKPAPHVHSIKNLKKKYNVIVVSNSFTDFLKKLIKKMKVQSYFNRVYGGDLFDDKAIFIKKTIKKMKLPPQQAVYIGDRDADVDVARKAGCISVIVSNKISWSSRKEIMKKEPDYVVRSLRDVAEVLN